MDNQELKEFSRNHGSHLESILKQRYGKSMSIFAKILKSYKPEELVKEEDEELLKGLLEYHTKS